MNIEKDFEKLYEGWKKGKYTIKDKNGKILGTYSSGGKAQKAMDDLMQKGDYDKLEVSIVEEKDWHDGHEPQGGYDHYDDEEEIDEAKIKHECPKCKGEGCEHCDGKGYHIEDEDDDPVGKKEASTYRDKQKKSKDKKQFGISRKKGNIRHGGSGYGEEIDEKKSATGYELYHKDFSSAMQHAYKFAKSKGHIIDPKEIDDKVATGPKKPSAGKTNRYSLKAGRKTVEIQVANLDNKRYELNMYIEGLELIPEGFKDLPPHLQKLVKKIEKKQKDWNKQNPNAKIKTLVYNPDTGKPDIEIKENTMKLEDTVKQVLTGKPKLEEHCGVCDEQGIEEDSDKDTPGTQGDMKKYQAARAKVMKKFGVKSCSELEGDEKKACYAALDAAHVSDDEEEKGEKKEEVKKSYSKMFSHVKSLMQEK